MIDEDEQYLEMLEAKCSKRKQEINRLNLIISRAKTELESAIIAQTRCLELIKTIKESK